jgi:DNA-binding MarR family transcriptional regulator
MDFEFLAFRQTAYHLYGRLFEPVLTRYGLTQMEMDILLFLSNNPQYDTAAELVAVRHLSKSQVSVSVDSLVRRGLLRRSPDSANRRVVHLAPEAAAGELVRAGQERQQLFFHTLLEGVSPEDQRRLEAILRQITDNARRACRQDGPQTP